MHLVATLCLSSLTERRHRLYSLREACVAVRASTHVANEYGSTQARLTVLVALVAVRRNALLLVLLNGNDFAALVDRRLKLVLTKVLLGVSFLLRF